MSEPAKNKILGVFVVLGYIALIAVNALAEFLPLNGVKTQDVADRYQNLFTPAPVTFLIWGLIYLLLAAFAIYGAAALFGKNEESAEIVKKIGVLFIGTCVLNCSWLLFWHYHKILLSVFVMILLLILLIMIYLKIPKDLTKKQYFFFKLPFSLYLGWISVATIANIAVYLTKIGWNGFGISPQIWTVIMVAAAVLLAMLMLLKRGDIAYALVIIWALIGIIIRQVTMYGRENSAIVVAAVIGISLLVLLIIRECFMRPKEMKMVK